MDELINRIEETVSALLIYDMESYAERAQSLAEKAIETFPVITDIYADPRMSDHAEDAAYWPAQLERIVAALNKGDDLSTADILYNETRANLIELKGILEEKGISL